jgi:toxin ParE1/3/4
VKLLLLPSADDDIRQFVWYVVQDLSDIARRFRHAVELCIESVLTRPQAGVPKYVRNPTLIGLRTWLVKGFDEFRIYYLLREDALIIVRVLHNKRDVGSILEKQSADDPAID